MRSLFGAIICAGLGVAATPALGQSTSPAPAEAVFAPFAVTQAPPRRAHAISTFEIAGESVSLSAYGRKARARRFDDMRESDELRKLSGAFDPAARPAVVTIEMSMNF